MQQKTFPDHLDFFRVKCKEHNLKVTPQRIAIYQELVKSKDHPSAEELFHTVGKQFPHISFDTVYRTLLTFSKIGIVTIVEGYRNRRRFDPNMDKHHHAHCIKCGKILDFTSIAFDNLEVPEAIQDEFIIIAKKVVINGICKECSKKTPNNPNRKE
ncbi:MAG: transcriptional repressor [Deltaproteobacteria bacterium]|nr:transcriptional repressor [Deltaproteobacteria bacterium]